MQQTLFQLVIEWCISHSLKPTPSRPSERGITMKVHFLGAAQEVTGSMHLIEVNNQRILLECGLWQGRRSETYERNLNFPFDPATITCLVLSHAHIDHSGNIPNLVKRGFRGNIWATTATRNLCAYMLMDSGHIQEQDAAYVNKQNAKRKLPPIEPLYTQADARTALTQFVTTNTGRPVLVANGVTVTFHPAGHILGAAFVQLDIEEFSTGKKWRVIFSGDLGRAQALMLKPPVMPEDADVVLMESTYGDRLHGSYDDARHRLRDIVNQTVRRQGKVIIPAFAVGRTQELVYALNQLDERGDIPIIPIFIDSPLAVEATDVFRMHPEEWNDEVQNFLTVDRKRNPFDDFNIEYVRDVRRSKQLNHVKESAVIISASGMAETGRILHHLKNNIGDADNTVLLVSFQAHDTLGRRLQDGVDPVNIFGQPYKVRARVETISGYSAHADQSELVNWARAFDADRLQNLYLVHGEPDAQSVLKELLVENGLSRVDNPVRGTVVEY